MNFSFHKKIPLSINITREAIRMVQIDRNKQIRSITSLPTPEGAFANDQIVNPHTIADAIKKSIGDIHPTPKEVIFSIPDSLCFSKIFTFEKKGNDTVTKNTLIELAKIHIPVDFEDTYWDYTRQTITPDTTTQSYLYVCALRSVIDPYIAIAQECGLSVNAIDTTAFALSRTIVYTEKKTGIAQKDTAVLILEGNTPTTSFSVFTTGNSLIYSGSIPITDIQKYSENTVLKTITSELKKTLDRIASITQLQITKIVLAGELAHIPDIEKTIEIDGVEVTLGDPVQSFKTSSVLSKKDTTAYSIALGLSLFTLYTEQKKPTVNFLRNKSPERKNTPVTPVAPSEISQENKSNKKTKNVLAYSFIILTFIGLGFVIYRYIITPFLLA